MSERGREGRRDGGWERREGCREEGMDCHIDAVY